MSQCAGREGTEGEIEELPRLQQVDAGQSGMKVWRNNGLSITLFALFLIFLTAQSLVGWHDENNEKQDHGQARIALTDYLSSGAFLEATMENWESEFLQMGCYVVLTVFLYQRGSSESKEPGGKEAVDRDPLKSRNKADAPSPVRKGGWQLKLYSSSLSIAFFGLFAISLVLHAVGGTSTYNESRALHGEPAVSVLGYMQSARFWFESFQNWQSEFLAIWCMVVFSIFLRQQGSPESKPVDAPHSQTGSG